MDRNRRLLLAAAASSAGCLGACHLTRRLHLPAGHRRTNHAGPFSSGFCQPPAFSITPVVLDGKWNWDHPPADQTGYVDPREFELTAGIRWRSDGQASHLRASTVVPIGFGEQEITSSRIDSSDACSAKVVPLSDTAAQLQMAAPHIRRGQTIVASVTMTLNLFRHCPGYSSEQFPVKQEFPLEIRKSALGNSPGIRSEMPGVRELAKNVASRHDHPWIRVGKLFEWVWENIHGRPGAYTSVQKAIRDKAGDCEERAGVFVALCRASGIPARLVLVPNHCWAEFCLMDHAGQPHWIPAHTAAYNWFGWTGAHELVLQKGDRIFQTGKDRLMRLVSDWYTFAGRRPIIEYFGELKPIEGPGRRVKNRRGGWDLDDPHPEARLLRS